MYNFIYYNHKHYVMFVQILHHISCTDNMSCYRILLNVQTSTHMLSDQSKLDTHTVSHNRCQQPLESYLLVQGINLIKGFFVTVTHSNNRNYHKVNQINKGTVYFKIFHQNIRGLGKKAGEL